jgi:hypothetical protein
MFNAGQSVAQSVEEIRASIADAQSMLQTMGAEGIIRGDEDPNQLLATGLYSALAAVSSSLGECRRDVPYSPLHPVIDEDGAFYWACNHSPEHRSV